LASQSFVVSAAEAGQTVAAFVRTHLTGQTWTQVRRLILRRRVKVGGDLCTDAARRLAEGDTLLILDQSAPKPRQQHVLIHHLDEHMVVVEKPSGIATVRHPAEREWTSRRKAQNPSLDELVSEIVDDDDRSAKRRSPRLRIVHRLDKETSGLVVFARTVAAERALGLQFKAHTVVRRYIAVIPGFLTSRRLESNLVRDRGDRRRGSTLTPGLGKRAVTHVEILERLGDYTMVACRLETGRTHQIRIHLAEAGHPICGEKVYNRRLGMEPREDTSGAPRLALHAAELGFQHPAKQTPMHWTMVLPPDLENFVAGLRPGRR
jgi:23S rRNA pseudouridine1911/1915/1917 synthase